MRTYCWSYRLVVVVVVVVVVLVVVVAAVFPDKFSSHIVLSFYFSLKQVMPPAHGAIMSFIAFSLFISSLSLSLSLSLYFSLSLSLSDFLFPPINFSSLNSRFPIPLSIPDFLFLLVAVIVIGLSVFTDGDSIFTSDNRNQLEGPKESLHHLATANFVNSSIDLTKYYTGTKRENPGNCN